MHDVVCTLFSYRDVYTRSTTKHGAGGVMRYRSIERYLSLIPILAGGLGILVGALVIIGWSIRDEMLVQIHPSLVPMQFNTALGMLLSGIGLIFIDSRWRRVSILCGAFVCLLGILTLFQYAFAVALGIDQLFMEHYITTLTSHPGRMAPNTALCFTLTGAALIYAIRKTPSLKYTIGMGSLGLLITTLGLVAFSGYLLEFEAAYGWGHLTRMAVHTAIAFIGLGTGITVLSIRTEQKTDPSQYNHWLPIPIGVLCILVAWTVSQALLRQEQRQIHQMAIREAQSLAHDIRESIQPRIESLERMARRWEQVGGAPKERWAQDAVTYTDSRLGYQAVAWVGPKMTMRWIVPDTDTHRAQNLQGLFEATSRNTLLESKQERSTSFTRTSDLSQGGKGFLIVVPIYIGDEFEGYLLGSVRLNQLLAPVMNKEARGGYTLKLFEESDLIYAHTIDDRVDAKGWYEEVDIQISNATWRVHVAPSIAMIEEFNTHLPSVVLFGGIIGSALFMLLIRFSQIAQNATKLSLVNEKRLRLALDAGLLGTWHWDIRTNAVEWDDALQRLFGLEPGTFEGTYEAWRRLVHPDDLVATEEAIQAALADGPAYDVEFRVNWPDGTERVLRTQSLLVRDLDGRPTEMIGTCVDVTDANAARDIIEQANEQLEDKVTERTAELNQANISLARSNEELEQFAYAASHDLKTPLITFLGYLKQLGKQVEADNKKGIDDSIARMQRAADHMRELIDDLLELSRIGRAINEPEPVDVSELAREFAEDSTVLLTEANLEIRVEDEMPIIVADKVRIRQIMQNLLSNAIKYGRSDDGGTIRVGSQLSDGEVRFFVQDDGPGISKEYHDKIFGLFQKLEGSSQGTGVGLTIVRRAIEWHGGRVWVESEINQGTTFWLALPKTCLKSSAA